jgi:hypothetical protein
VRHRTLNVLVATLVALSSCVADPAERTAEPGAAEKRSDYVLLVPDSQNSVVHRIALDGSYEGDFVAPASKQGGGAPPMALRILRGALFLAGEPGVIWLTARHGMSEWETDGRFRRMLPLRTDVLENPTAILAAGDEVLVLSEDKKRILVLGRDGALAREIKSDALDGATDCEVGPDGLFYVSSALRSSEQTGLISVWDFMGEANAEPLRHLVPPEYAGGRTFVRSLVFDDDGHMLITNFSEHRVERWNVATNERIEVLLQGAHRNDYTQLARGPDGLVYLAGGKGIYRFDSRAGARQLQTLEPLFRADMIAGRYERPFSPEAFIFVPRAKLGAVQPAGQNSQSKENSKERPVR